MLRKIFRTGNSIVVSIPKYFLDELDLSEGEDVSIELDRQQRQIVISLIEKDLAVGVDETFARQVDEFIKEYRPGGAGEMTIYLTAEQILGSGSF